MCKILLTIVLFFSFSFMASAQFNKGDVLLGGQLGYSGYKNTDPAYPDQKVNSGNFTVSIGKAVNTNAVFGISLSYLPNTQSNYYTTAGNVDYKNNGYAVGIFYRMYKSLGKEFYVFGEGGISYNGSTTSGKDASGNKILTGSSNGGSLYIMPGIAYRISKKFFLEITIPDLFSASYTNQKTTVSGVSNTNDQFAVGANLSSNPLNNIGVGFRLVL